VCSFTNELVADPDAIIDVIMTDDEAVDEGKNRCQVAGYTRVIA